MLTRQGSWLWTLVGHRPGTTTLVNIRVRKYPRASHGPITQSNSEDTVAPLLSAPPGEVQGLRQKIPQPEDQHQKSQKELLPSGGPGAKRGLYSGTASPNHLKHPVSKHTSSVFAKGIFSMCCSRGGGGVNWLINCSVAALLSCTGYNGPDDSFFQYISI